MVRMVVLQLTEMNESPHDLIAYALGWFVLTENCYIKSNPIIYVKECKNFAEISGQNVDSFFVDTILQG